MTEHFKDEAQARTGWQALKLFSFFRVILAGFLLFLSSSGQLPDPFGNFMPAVFSSGVIIYLGVAVFFVLLVNYRQRRFREQVFTQVLSDFVAFGVLMYASGGVGSGIGLLLVMTVAAGSLLLNGRVAYLFAAIGALVILLVELLVLAGTEGHVTNFMQAGLLGGVLFATSSLAHILAKRIRESEALAAQRGEDLASLSRMNERIVQRMRSGLLVLDKLGNIHLANVAAAQFLGESDKVEGGVLAELAPEINEALNRWLRGEPATSLISPEQGTTDIQLSFTFLGNEEGSDVLVFMEDAATIRQKAQQLKLASLGQLTASIAHEIRNPLGAISHAGQLLNESPHLDESDQRLLQIINEHSSRVNQIIENILRLGRRDDSIPESLQIQPWLEKFVADFKLHHKLSDQDVSFAVEGVDIHVTMDQSQLHQIMTNLCENALRYSKHLPKIHLSCAVNEESQRPFLDVIDTGEGIAKDQSAHIFEPFFTDRTGGTGLGLYIASELCEANQAVLALQKNSSEGCCFRINFAHPNKQIHIE